MPQTAPQRGDLPALDILRGHDFGIQPANVIRQLFGLPRINDFDELFKHIRDPEVRYKQF